jgi:hypothetical protein
VIINYSRLNLLFLPPLLRNDLAIAAQVLFLVTINATVRNQPVGGGGNYVPVFLVLVWLKGGCSAALRAQLINEQNRALRAPPAHRRHATHLEKISENLCLGKTVTVSPNSTMQMQVALLNKWFFGYT